MRRTIFCATLALFLLTTFAHAADLPAALENALPDGLLEATQGGDALSGGVEWLWTAAWDALDGILRGSVRNAALLTLAERVEAGARPALIIGAPVGFVNVVESKERAYTVCQRHGVPVILAMGRKGGSGVAAAICNALLYAAAGLLDPSSREY